jgi:hypothetical protein
MNIFVSLETKLATFFATLIVLIKSTMVSNQAFLKESSCFSSLNSVGSFSTPLTAFSHPLDTKAFTLVGTTLTLAMPHLLPSQSPGQTSVHHPSSTHPIKEHSVGHHNVFPNIFLYYTNIIECIYMSNKMLEASLIGNHTH